MKNIIVYIVVLIMMMPSMSLLAEVDLKTSDLFNTKATPFKNSPFVGGNPKNIERNLFTPKQIKVQKINQYKTDLNHNNYNNKTILNTNTPISVTRKTNITTNQTEIRKYNSVSQIAKATQATNVTYSMPTNSGIRMNTQNEAFSEESTDETTSSTNNNPYEGSGAPPEFAPIGNAVLPLLLFVGIYLIKLRNKKSSVKI